ESPFPGPGSQDFLRQHIGMAPRRLDEANPALAEHPKLVALMMQCLEKNAALRPASAHVLYEKLLALWPQSPSDSSVTTPGRRVLAPAVATPVPASEAPAQASGETSARWREAQAKAAAATQAIGVVATKGVRAAQGLPSEWKQSLAVVFGLTLLAPAVW